MAHLQETGESGPARVTPEQGVPARTDDWDSHYNLVLRHLTRGRVVPFLGAGANLCRGAADVVSSARPLPSGKQLAEELANDFFYPPDETRELQRIAQYVALASGLGDLYEALRARFDADYPPTSLHRLLAAIPGILRGKGYPEDQCHQLIVTTNYDDVLERSFREADEEFDLVWYVADGRCRGRFQHLSPEGKLELIESPNTYVKVSPQRRSVILKIHGAINRTDDSLDSYVITEDHYIDYLAHTDPEPAGLIPAKLLETLRHSHCLFLGYSLSDWNLRVILRRIWGEDVLPRESWAIDVVVSDLNRRFWNMQHVDIRQRNLVDYVAELEARLRAWPSYEGGP